MGGLAGLAVMGIAYLFWPKNDGKNPPDDGKNGKNPPDDGK